MLNLTSEIPSLYSILKLRINFNSQSKLLHNYYGVYNEMDNKFNTVLAGVANRLDYFNNLNITELDGEKKSRTPLIIKLCGMVLKSVS